VVSVVEDHGLMRLMAPFMSGPSRKKSKSSLRASEETRNNLTLGPERERKDSQVTSSARWKAWFKRKLLQDSPANGDVVVLGNSLPSETSLAHRPLNSEPSAEAKRTALAAARRVLFVASKDLNHIEQSMSNADRLISQADRSIIQADRLIKKALGQRETSLDRIRLIQQMSAVQQALQDTILGSSPGLPEISIPFPEEDFGDFLPVTIPTSPRNSTLIFPRPPQSLSSKSSLSSLTSTLIDDDHDDLRALRKLLTHKIEDRTDGALEEIEKVSDWLRVVKDCAVGLKHRTQNQLHR